MSADYSNAEQLEALYSVRLREIEQLRDEIQYLKDKYEADRSELSAALNQAVADKERTASSRNEIQQLLRKILIHYLEFSRIMYLVLQFFCVSVFNSS